MTPFEGVAGFGSFPIQVSVRRGGGEVERRHKHGPVWSPGRFLMSSASEPMLGRALNRTDTEAPGRNAVAVISHRYWQQALSSDPSMIGRTLTINGTLFTVVGVMPASFYGVELNEEMPDMWLPLTMQQIGDAATAGLAARSRRPVLAAHDRAAQDRRMSVAQAQAWIDDPTSALPDGPRGSDVSALRRQ